MSLRVFAADANPCVDAFLYRQSNLRGEEIVASGRGMFITLADGRRAVQLLPQDQERSEKSVGRGNLIPFGRVYNRMMDPPSLSYEIPHAGDIGIWRHQRKFIKVSARNGKRIIAAAFQVPTGVLTNSTSLSPSSPMQQMA